MLLLVRCLSREVTTFFIAARTIGYNVQGFVPDLATVFI